jgi:hypothetical protein
MIYGSWRNDWTYLCNLQGSWNGIPSENMFFVAGDRGFRQGSQQAADGLLPERCDLQFTSLAWQFAGARVRANHAMTT